ncbi:50S ribosomal protein L15 [Geitlerinema sp. P-1104]|uniref:50S ribosomal protein L15 n=1 Tax=Geitlerinema sp. P-1104 TaxID=2546230 RepID=UPI0014157525|nr:50S ribosomal protein L15 [Geitlerinema sp. P-1104]NMG57342.1 50S ribosomal protein L15 [Geitlerinema sp. P-1104]TVR10299.1 MAG: 50S ribosomal protein L15 [Phormidium sp. GEM2.Bin31]
MRLQDVQPQPGSKKRRRRLGRGIAAGQGASCGKGMRGQKSRSGGGTRPGFEGGQMPLYRRVPKLKHFTVINPKQYTIVNVGQLASFAANSEVTLASVLDANIVNSQQGPLKILGDGELTVALTVTAAAFTRSARQKIEAAGGRCELSTGNTSDNGTQADNAE